MARIHAYLNFNGNCEEAFQFYETVFQTSNTGIYRYGSMDDGSGNFPEEAKNKVLHISIQINEHAMIMGSDVVEGLSPKPVLSGNQTYVMIDVDAAEEAKRLYEALSEGSPEIEMGLESTFFAELYASFQDKFGIWWMIHYEGNVQMG